MYMFCIKYIDIICILWYNIFTWIVTIRKPDLNFRCF
jgi:hypothetical protein